MLPHGLQHSMPLAVSQTRLHVQGPTVDPIGKEFTLMAEPENSEVDAALDAYTNVRQSIMALQIEASLSSPCPSSLTHIYQGA